MWWPLQAKQLPESLRLSRRPPANVSQIHMLLAMTTAPPRHCLDLVVTALSEVCLTRSRPVGRASGRTARSKWYPGNSIFRTYRGEDGQTV